MQNQTNDHMKINTEKFMNYIGSQFGNPRGLIGHLVGLIMAYENRARNQWALSLLDIQPTDRILEIGFGPGWAVQEASKIAQDGLVAGVDRSLTMVKQATVRNRIRIKSGHVSLRLGTATEIPFDNGVFNKVYAVNSFHEWDDPMVGLQETRRVLRRGGLLLIVEHPHEVSTKTKLKELQTSLSEKLNKTHFIHIQSEIKHIQKRPALSIQALRS